ncbi:MAG: hypothetical protein DHS20C18_41560 [Saprospiraceae bacterium]|nr:MAG: hypothetical protein DHS20C18_41560 [Saprospiraceae bacterium]
MAYYKAMKSLLYNLLGVCFSLVVIFVLGELISIGYYEATPVPVVLPPYDYRQLDEDFGWLTKANYSYSSVLADLAGAEYKVELTTNQFGFRAFGDTETDTKAKVLFIGDSYTYALEVSDSKTYYNILADTLSFEAFAYGSGGYGNLQEYLILDQYFELINPDVVVLQVCSNDFMDNYHKLEIASFYTVGKKRPYLNSKDNIIYRTPIPFLEQVKDYSKFIYFIGKKIESIKNHEDDPVKLAEELIAIKGNNYPLFTHSVDITELILKRFKARIPKETQFLVFSADHFQPQYDEFKRICQKNEISFLSGLPFDIERAEKKGIPIRGYDGFHWNEAGHRVVANLLSVELDKILDEQISIIKGPK